MLTPRKTVCAPFTFLIAIEAAIFKEIIASPHKRCRSPLPPPPSPPPSPSSSLIPSPLPAMLPPRKRFRMTSPHQDTMAEAITPARLRRRFPGRHCISTEPHILPVISEPIQYTIPLLLARIVRHKDHIHKMQDHLEELLLERFEAIEQDIEGLRDDIKT
ncbi:hypothetical protein Tco_1312050 [Tanacetum coccineum]